MSTALVWFRRDLRVHDNPALATAANDHERLVCVFCFERPLLTGRHASPRRNAYLLDSLRDLDASLRAVGGRLAYRVGAPDHEIPSLARELDARAVYWNRDYTPHAVTRDASVARVLDASRIEAVSREGIACAELDTIRTGAGRPYRVFTPFYRAWTDAPRRSPLPVPARISTPPALRLGRQPSRADLGIDPAAVRVARRAGPGERNARAAIDAAVEVAREYADTRDRLDREGTTRLSAALHFGCLSARELEARLRRLRSAGARELRRQLAWRDFWLQVIGEYPDNRHLEYDPRLRGMRWSRDPDSLVAWQQGQTGFPLVDAGMRQLLAEGLMHNRARMLVASFLSKNLLLDWRLGEAHFMRLLLDGDEAQNNGNWQWAASVGADAQPYFRVFSPTRQQRRFDPTGEYVRRWVAELRRLPDRWLAEPWLAPAHVQHRSGCVVGRDYPAPVVDLKASADEARVQFAAAIRS